MPTFGDMTQFLGGQYFGKTFIPKKDLTGKCMIVTGGNTGLGLDCAKHLVKLNLSTLILACRNVEKGEAAKQSILSETGNRKADIQVWQVDLDSYASVMSFTERVRTQLPRLDGFVANAGIEINRFEESEGLEKTLNINVVSTYLMALGILPKLRETSFKFNVETVLTLVGSMIHVFGSAEQLSAPAGMDVFEARSDPKTAAMGNRYPLSKLILHLCYLELAERVTGMNKESHVVVNLVNPGWCKTELHRYNGEPFMERAMAVIFRWTSEKGSRTLVHAVTAGKETHGKYLSECQEKPMSAYARSGAASQAQKLLWRELMARLERIQPGVERLAGIA